MIENYEHHITKSMRSLYKKRLSAPIIYLIFLIFIWFYFGVFSVLFPSRISNSDSLEILYKKHESYILGFFIYVKTFFFAKITAHFSYSTFHIPHIFYEKE